MDIETLLQEALAAQTQKPKTVMLTAKDAFAPQPDPEWVVDGLLLPGSVALFAGAPGSKKTWALLNLAACVAAGQDWLGRKTKQMSILWVDEESGRRRLLGRMRKVFEGIGASENLPFYATVMNRFDLRNDEDVQRLEGMITDCQAGLVIIDALADVAPGADENSVKDMMLLMGNLRRLAESLDIVIVLIHHNTKSNGSAYRGSSAIAGAAALMVAVQSEAKEGLVKFDIVKHWDGEPGTFYAVAEWDDFSDTFTLTPTAQSKSPQLSNAEVHVLTFVGDNQAAELAAIQASTLAFTASTLKTAVVELVKRGFLANTSQNSGGRGRRAVYTLTAQGEKAYEQVKNG